MAITQRNRTSLVKQFPFKTKEVKEQRPSYTQKIEMLLQNVITKSRFNRVINQQTRKKSQVETT